MLNETLCEPRLSKKNGDVFATRILQELRYCEFFAGEGNVFREVRGNAYASMAVDITYLQGMMPEGRTNPFDFMTPAGMASLVGFGVTEHTQEHKHICKTVLADKHI